MEKNKIKTNTMRMDKIVFGIDLMSKLEVEAILDSKKDKDICNSLKEQFGPLSLYLFVYGINRRSLISQGVDVKEYDDAIAQSTSYFNYVPISCGSSTFNQWMTFGELVA